MMTIEGSEVEPIDPSRLPYNRIDGPLPRFLMGAIFFYTIAALLAKGAFALFLADTLFLSTFLSWKAVFLPAGILAVLWAIYVAIRNAVHAALRLDAYDAALDEQVEAQHSQVRRGYLSPERAAQVSAL